MAVYKVKATYSVDIEIEIDADSEDAALSKLYGMDFRDVVDDGSVFRADSEDETAELAEAEFTVKATNISYDVTFNDCWDLVVDEHPGIDEDSEEFDNLVNAKIDEIKKSLPQELILTVDCEKEDLDDYVAEAISDETNWLVNGCDYEIVSIK